MNDPIPTPPVDVPNIIVPPAPDDRDAKIAGLEQALAEVDAVLDPLIGATSVHRADFLKEQIAKLAGAEQAAASAQLERDAARKALDTALEEPCTLCGKQRKDRD